jgi:hypothetical protein
MSLLQHRVDTVSFKITEMILNTNLQASQIIHLTSPMSCDSLHKYLHKQSLLNWDESSKILKPIATINEVPSEYEVRTSSTSNSGRR